MNPPPRPLSPPFLFPFTPPLPFWLVRTRPPPPTLPYLHNHYNVHVLCDGCDRKTEISEDDWLIVQNHEIPTVPLCNTFIYNPWGNLTEPPLPSRIQEELDPGQDHEVHNYLHMHYYHVGEGYDGWDDYNDDYTKYFRNHFAPDQLLIQIENRYPRNRGVVHIHKQVHFDEEETIPTESSDSTEDDDDDEGGDGDEKEDDDDEKEDDEEEDGEGGDEDDEGGDDDEEEDADD